jgi:L-iditol 2-dehydrogenase
VLGVSPGTYKRNGAFAEYITIPEHILYRIPENVTFEQAAMVEAVAVAMHSINISRIKPGNTCLVVGAGMIGIFIIKLLKISGASYVFAVDISENRLEKAGRAGADIVLHAGDRNISERIKELTGNRGADISFDAAGKNDSVGMAINYTRKGGKVVLVGNTSPAIDFPLQNVVTGELKILGSCAICGEYETILELMKLGRVSVDEHVSAIVPLSEGALWFRKLYNKEGDLDKVILVP